MDAYKGDNAILSGWTIKIVDFFSSFSYYLVNPLGGGYWVRQGKGLPHHLHHQRSQAWCHYYQDELYQVRKNKFYGHFYLKINRCV